MSEIKIQDLTLKKLLGKGTMGEVYLSQKDKDNKYYATKKIDKIKADRPQVRKYFRTELEILRDFKHKNIVRFFDLKQTKGHYYIVMEYCNGGTLSSCLNKYIKMKNKPFSEETVQYLMRQIVSGLKYIHRKGIIHRDIKLDNILVKFYQEEDLKNLNMRKTHVKISDFGISIRPGQNQLAFTAVGSPANMDPFILKKLTERNDLVNSQGYDQSADIWSLGSICYEMLIGKRVFNGRNIKGLQKKIEVGNYVLPTNLSKEVISFINGMLQYDPKKRLNIEQLSRHHFLTRNVKDFHPIDFSLIYNKIGEKGIVINIKENKTIWQAFNADNTGNQKNLQNNKNNNNNNINNSMWNIFDKETELKLSMISPQNLDQVPYSENETTDNNFTNNSNNNNAHNKNHINQQSDKNVQKMNVNNINNHQINNYNNQINQFHSDNRINRLNPNFNVTNSHIPLDYNYPKEFANPGKNGVMANNINNYASINNFNQNNNMNLYHGNNNIPINQTQIYPQNYPGDIKIIKRAATTEESCMHQ